MRFRHSHTGLYPLYDPYDFVHGESPTDLVYSRTHEELRRRKHTGHNTGLHFREKLNCKDYSNTE